MPRDYYPLIARAIAGLEKNTRGGRDAVYQRARAAQRIHFDSIADPAVVLGEHQALEDAIRTVESEFAPEFAPLSPSTDPATSHVEDDADQPSPGGAPPTRYRGFLSYCHADTAVAQRVHGRLEGFRVDKDLVGRVTSMGAIPKRLRPIFRDRFEFDAGGSLADATVAALDESSALIVLASSKSARSEFVDDEVRLFRFRHPDRPVIPVIVDGTPGDADDECFPPALFSASAESADGRSAADLVAADLRDTGDGFDLAIAKIVARLLGLPPDDVYRRAQRERRRQFRLKLAAGAVVASLAIVAAGLFWQSHQQGETLTELTALAEKYTLAAPPQTMAPGTRDNLVRVFTSIARGEAIDPRNAKALALLKSGDIAAAEAVLKAVAEDQAKRSERDAKEAATAYRNLASISALSDPARARTYFAEAARLDPTDIQGLLSNAWFQEHAGELDAAQAGYNAIVSRAKTSKDDHEAFWAQIGLGNIQQRRQDLAAALQTYQTAKGIAERMARDGGVAAGEQQESLAAAYTDIGDVKMKQGDLPDAAEAYRAALAAREQAAKADPNDAEVQLSLGTTYERIAGVALAQGNLPDALAMFRDKQRIVEGLAKSSPSNAAWQRDLALSYGRVGEVLFAQENVPEALQAYRTSLSIIQPLAQSDPDNAELQLDLSQPYERIGDALLAQGNLPEALASLQMCLAIRQKLSAKDPTNWEWQHGVWVVYSKLGDVLMAQQNAAAATPFRRSALAIAEQLINVDPNNTDYRRDLSISYDRMGDVLFVLGNQEETFKYYQASLRAAYDLAKAAPTDLELQHDVVRSFRKLSAFYLLTNQADKAREALSVGRGMIARMVEAFPDRTRWREELSWFDQKLATLK